MDIIDILRTIYIYLAQLGQLLMLTFHIDELAFHIDELTFQIR